MADAGQWDQHRTALTGFCYRMLGSGFEAEDAVQETLIRAWRNADRFDERRGSARSWLFAIAANVCIDMCRSAQRRALPIDLSPPASPGDPLGALLPDGALVHPIPDALVLPPDPADQVAARETIRLAFVAALQHLPARQRAALILHDVLCFSAEEAAHLLDSTAPAVNSLLQRARATISERSPTPDAVLRPEDPAQRRLLARYVEAFESHDVETLVALLHEDAVLAMPPLAWWLRGREDIGLVLRLPDNVCAGDRLLPTAANGSPAFGQYRDGKAFALLALDLRGDRVAAATTHLDAGRLFPLFGLPENFPSHR
ncbi:MAG: RNA polymerase subunit sigma-70 [Micromonosporaceae bacterium]|nr:RNA polymerase subunit sigma-70 [Micromonosporaceae bacterium]